MTKQPRYFCRVFLDRSPIFQDRIPALLKKAGDAAGDHTILRLVFFTDAEDKETYDAQRNELRDAVSAAFPSGAPLWSLIAQKPVDGSPGPLTALEAHYYTPAEAQLSYKQLNEVPYILVEGRDRRELFLTVGSHCAWVPDCVPVQPHFVFEKIAAIMKHEGFPVESIRRQWNYVEKITDTTHGCQHYQALNDARSDFYSQGDWSSGYPAATGIGTLLGGITVDLNAAVGVSTAAIDNPLQRAAHVYSEQVLRQGKSAAPSTPKFERARSVLYDWGTIVYVSGTAAIRNEHSLSDANVGEQTLATLENIAHLTEQAGAGTKTLSARIYLKYAKDYLPVRRLVEKEYPGAELLFIQADVCRPELLMEIESMAAAV